MPAATKRKDKINERWDRDNYDHSFDIPTYPAPSVVVTMNRDKRWSLNSWRWPVIIVTGLLIAAAVWLVREPIAELMVLLSDQEAVSARIQSYGVWAPLVLGVAQMVQVLVAFIPGHVFVIAAGYIYGFPAGFALNLFCVVSASQLAYSLARWAGRPLVNRLAPPEQIDKWEAIAEKQGFLFFTIAFILPVFPTDAMNFVAGLSGLSPRRFLAANVLGRVPHSVVLTLIGSHGLELSPFTWGVLIVLVAVVYVAGHFAIVRIERRHSRRAPEDSDL